MEAAWELIRLLGSSDPDVRARAEEELRADASDGAEGLQYGLATQWYGSLVDAPRISLLMLCALAVGNLGEGFHRIRVGAYVALAFYAAWAVCCYLLPSPRRRRAAVLRIVDGLDEPAAAPVLISAWRWETGALRRAIEAALVRLLPRVGECGYFDYESRVCLAELLRVGSVDLVLAALRALAVVGGEGQIDAVRAVARGRGSRRWVGRDPRVRDAALRALEAMGARTGKAGETQWLVRPAEGADDTLVRAARGDAERVERLVRPCECDRLREPGPR